MFGLLIRWVVCTLIFLAYSALSPAQTFPVKPIRLVVGFAAGGVADTSARAVADRLGARLGQQVVVENRPGASGNISAEMVAKSDADGHTLLLGFDGSMVINPHIFSKQIGRAHV